jgi:hypothetical protein
MRHRLAPTLQGAKLMGKSQRSKGRKGQREFRRLLEDRDWQVAELNGGTSVEDFLGN